MRCIKCEEEVAHPITKYRWICECGFRFATAAVGNVWYTEKMNKWVEVPEGCLLVIKSEDA